MGRVLLNKDQIGRAFGVSAPTVDGWLKAGLPVVSDGKNGRPYEIDPDAVRTWLAEREASAVALREAQEARVREVQASLDLQDGHVEGVDALSATQRRQYYEAEQLRMKVATARGELVLAPLMLQEMTTAFGLLADRLQSLPDVLERDCGLPPEAVDRVASAVDAWQENLAEALTRWDFGEARDDAA